jgi:Membrane-bound serine protease (ClpP class)
MIALVITLIVVGLLLLAAELIILPGFGVAGILGIVSLVASCWISFVYIGNTAGIIVIAVCVLLVIISTIFVLRSKTWRKLTLNTNIDAKVDTTPEQKGIKVGDFGKAITRLAPSGKIEIGGEVIEVFTRDSIIEPGNNVIISELDGNKIFVQKN